MVVAPENTIVHGLWIGSRLSKLELLTLYSYLKQGHQFHLWLYEPLQNTLPEGVIIRDANQIVPKEKIYRRKHNDPACGVGKGSVGSPFSDWFRYKLLYQEGGWWSDMDVTCLQPLDFPDAYVFREHDKLQVIGNVMKAPRHCELMRITAQKVEEQCNEETIDWLLPNKLLAATIRELGLSEYIKKNISNRDIWPETVQYVMQHPPLHPEWRVFHWMQEEWRMRNIDKDNISPASALGSLLYEHGLGRKALFTDMMLLKLKTLFA